MCHANSVMHRDLKPKNFLRHSCLVLASSRNQGCWEHRLHHRRNWHPSCFCNCHHDRKRQKEENEENENVSQECRIEKGAKKRRERKRDSRRMSR